MTELVCIGSSHHTASISARERFAMIGHAQDTVVESLLASANILEVVPLMTCNRSELYMVTDNLDETISLTYAALARYADIPADELMVLTDCWTGEQAVTHLMNVASGLDSQVLGEVEILGQVKRAMHNAADNNWSRNLLDRLFQHALKAGKRVRTDTTISYGHASVASAAAQLLIEHLPAPQSSEVLVIGAGEMGSQAARALFARGVKTIRIVNRNMERAQRLATKVGGTAHSFREVADLLKVSTAVVTATRAPHWLLTPDNEKQRAILDSTALVAGIDLSVPRNIDPAFAARTGMKLSDIDDLEGVVQQTNDQRKAAAIAAEVLVAAISDEFMQWLKLHDVTPVITGLKKRAETLRAREFDRFLRKVEHLPAEDRRRIDQLTKSIVNKLLHEPMVNLREATVDETIGAPQLATHTAALFGLEITENNGPRIPIST